MFAQVTGVRTRQGGPGRGVTEPRSRGILGHILGQVRSGLCSGFGPRGVEVAPRQLVEASGALCRVCSHFGRSSSWRSRAESKSRTDLGRVSWYVTRKSSSSVDQSPAGTQPRGHPTAVGKVLRGPLFAWPAGCQGPACRQPVARWCSSSSPSWATGAPVRRFGQSHTCTQPLSGHLHAPGVAGGMSADWGTVAA